MVIGSSKNIGIVVVAAGSGSRYGASIPKQFLELNGKPVLFHCIDTFKMVLPESSLVVVLSEWGKNFVADYCKSNNRPEPMYTFGGATRGESVLNGLKALKACGLSDDAIVLIHDGARPLLSEDLISRLVEQAEKSVGAVPSLPISDSLVQIDNNGFTPVARSHYRSVQTPQVFHLGNILEAYTIPGHENYTDDLSLMKAAGFDNIDLVDGQESNIKITRPLDLEIARLLMK